MKDISLDRILKGKYTEALSIKGTRWIYYSLPKCANTSIRYVINKHNGLNAEKFSEIHGINKFRLRERDLKRLLKNGYQIFTFIRNDRNRLKSSYRDFILNKGDRDGPYSIGVSRKMRSYEKFEKDVQKIPNSQREVHLQSVNYLIRSAPLPRGKKFDFIGKVENMDKDWKKICEKICVNWGKLPHLHVTKK